MFDIGFWELALIGVISLLVVGPERLPALARNVGLWVGRVRRYVAHVKQDIERELHAEELRELMEKRDGLADLRKVAEDTASVLEDARSGLDEAARASEREAAGGPGAAGDARTPGPAPDESATPSRRVAHHAVDEDPFAPASLAGVSPGDAGAARPADSTESDNEPGTDRQGRR